jgi:hypothetical protein
MLIDPHSTEPFAGLRAHYEEIDGAVREVLAIVELLERPLFDARFTERFANTYAAHGLDLVRRNLHRAAVIIIGRLWDCGNDARSIPNLWQVVSSDQGRDNLIRRRRSDALRESPKMDRHIALTDNAKRADEAESDARSQMDQLRILIENQDAAEIRQSLLILRNRIAHAVELTQREKQLMKRGVGVEKAKWGDLSHVVRHSAEVAAALATVTQDLSVTFEDSQTTWATYATHFWAPFVNPT